MSVQTAKKIADFIFEGTGKGVNALMRKFGLSKSATAKLSPDKLARVIQQKGTQFYKDGVKAGNVNTGRLVIGASSIGAVLNQIWNEFDPTKIKKMGDGTLRAEDKKSKRKGPPTRVATKNKAKPPEPPKSRPKVIKKVAPKVEDKKKQLMMKEKYSGKDSNVKFNARGGMMKKYSKGGMTKKGKK